MSGSFAFLLTHFALVPQPAAGTAESIPAQGNAWHIATADVFGDSAPEIVYACYDGAIGCQSSAGTARWSFNTGAFPYDLAVSDLDGDQKSEVLVASADGHLTCVGSNGSLRWRFAAEAPLYQVTVIQSRGRVQVLTGGVDRKLYILDANGRMEKAIAWPKSIRLIRAGDLDGDQHPEAVVVCWTGEVQAFRWPDWKEMWRRDLRRESARGPRGDVWFAHSLVIDDLDGDGPCELIFGSGVDTRLGVRVMSGDGSLRWEKVEAFETSEGGAMGHTAVALCNFGGPLGRQIAALDGRFLFLIDRTGRTWAKGAAPVSFTNLCSAEPETATPAIYLSSSPNGDDRIFRVGLGKGWERSFGALRREGAMGRIGQNLDRIRKQIMDYRGSPPTDQTYVHVVGAGQIASTAALESLFSLVGYYRRLFPYPNSTFAIHLSIQPDEPVHRFAASPAPPGGSQVPRAQFIEMVTRCEKANVPFILSVSHGCLPWVPLDLVEQAAIIGRRTCLGFLSSEDDGDAEQIGRFLGEYWLPLMGICKRAGKKAFLVEKHAWWVTVPAMRRFRELVDESFSDVVVMSVEDSNSRCPELNLAGRLGLFLSGTVRHISARTVKDEMCWNRQWEWESSMTGHPFLRRQMVQALCGAEYFEHMLPLRAGVPVRPGGFSAIGAESAELVIHMLGKGLLVPPAPNEMAALSPQMIRMREPDARFVREAFNIHGHDTFTPDREEFDSPFEGLACHRGAAPVRPAYVGGYLFGIERHSGGFIPATPYGLVAIVPNFVDHRRCFWAKDAWETDGRWWFEGAKRRSGLEARSSVIQSFEQAAAGLAIRLEGRAFMQVQRIGSEILRATLIDAGFLDPADRPVKLRVREDLRVNRIADILSGEMLGMRERTVALTVPAGAFRIIEFHGQF